jgi:hypothetical protein
MIAGIYNLTCEQGTTFSRLIEIEQPDLVNDPSGQTYIEYSLVGYRARMQVRRTVDAANYLVYLTSENNGLRVVPGIYENQMQIFMSASVTASITQSGVYDIEIIDAEGFVSRVLQGSFTLIPEVTR